MHALADLFDNSVVGYGFADHASFWSQGNQAAVSVPET